MSQLRLKRYFYSDTLSDFKRKSTDSILGELASENLFNLELTQRNAWMKQIEILQETLSGFDADGQVFFEYAIPRLGKRIDVVLVIHSVVFILEFKVGEREFQSNAIDQVWDYALDLKNFHETTHHKTVAPILIATESKLDRLQVQYSPINDLTLEPICCNRRTLKNAIELVLEMASGQVVDPQEWSNGRYRPTPTIIEAATALYNNHTVEDISIHDSGQNLQHTTKLISESIVWAHTNKKKAICFVTGVPGAGKTLVGLDVATKHTSKDDGLHSVFLSGNGPLVAVLQEALAVNKKLLEKEQGRNITKSKALSEVKMFIQNVHHFRDECLRDFNRPPIEHVAIFDEAQRAWNLEQTKKFMESKKQVSEFNYSEPEYLISCLDRHDDWALIVCLVVGGQEIHTGEAGIREWIDAIINKYPDWHVFISPHLKDKEYNVEEVLERINNHHNVKLEENLHLAVSMRSFRSEKVSLFVKKLLDQEISNAQDLYEQVIEKYPIVLTRDLKRAKKWLRNHARGSERYGIVVSSQAQRLKPYAIDVRSKIDPVNWFLKGKEDVRSSYYLEDVATEFHVQGLELDWACVTWDADFRKADNGWDHWSFVGDRWNRILKKDRQQYQINAYRVLMTRARHGMIIVVPEGDEEDPTRKVEYYDPTFEYLREIGMKVV